MEESRKKNKEEAKELGEKSMEGKKRKIDAQIFGATHAMIPIRL